MGIRNFGKAKGKPPTSLGAYKKKTETAQPEPEKEVVEVTPGASTEPAPSPAETETVELAEPESETVTVEVDASTDTVEASEELPRSFWSATSDSEDMPEEEEVSRLLDEDDED